MKKIYLLLLIMCLAAIGTQAQLTTAIVNKDVIYSEEYSYFIFIPEETLFYKITSSNHHTSGKARVQEYNESNGQNWVFRTRDEYEYDDKGNTTEYVYFKDTKDTPSSRITYEYEDGLLVKSNHFTWNNTLSEWKDLAYTTYTYDSHNNLTQEEDWIYNGSDWNKSNESIIYINEYNEQELLSGVEKRIRHTSTTEDKTETISTYQYNDKGLLSYEKIESFKVGEEGIRTFTLKYNELGNIIEMNQENKFGPITNGITMKMEYNNNDRMSRLNIYASGMLSGYAQLTYPETTNLKPVDKDQAIVNVTNDMLFIDKITDKTIDIYSVSGAKLTTLHVDSGRASTPTVNFPKGVLIVKGSNGWAKKIIVQ